MKKYRKYFLLLIIVFVFVPLIKNTYLYFSYHNEPTKLIKVDENWIGAFDLFKESTEFRQFTKVKKINDTLGVRFLAMYGEKIDGKYSEPYSWHSLLPFAEPKIINDTIILVSKEYTNWNIDWDHAILCKIVNDSMYISRFFYPDSSKIKESASIINLRKKYFSDFFSDDFNYELYHHRDSNDYTYWEVVNIKVIPGEWKKLYKEIIQYL